MKLKLRPHLALPALFLLFLLASCRREESLETGFTSRYMLEDTFGNCYGNTVHGTYRLGQALTDSNYLELTLHVDVTGRYAINTEIQNGFSFTGTGSFTDTGMTTIRIPGRGTPIAEGITTLRISHDSGYCEVNVTVLGSAPVNGGGSCSATATGTFKKDTTLNATHKVTLQHNFTTAGTYTVTTDTINGYYFNKSVAVATAGNQTITLDGYGTPAALGTNNFTVRFGDGSNCNFSITVVQGTSTGGGACGSINGAYTVGTALTAANTFTTNTHVYNASGTFTVQVSSTAPGLTTTTVAVTATSAGSSPAITVPLAGTPTAAGTYPVNIDFGDGSTCVLSLTVTGSGGGTGNYFPLTVNSWWSYNDPLGQAGDTLTRRNVHSAVFNSTTYRGFVEFNNINNPEDTFYYFKEPSGTTNMSVDLNDYFFGYNVTFPAGTRGTLPIVKDVLTTGATWLSNAYTGDFGGGSVQVRVKFTCVNAAGTVTVGSRTFNNVYEVNATFQYNQGLGWQDFPFSGDLGTQWFAPNVGLIKESHLFPTTPMELRNYQVN